jgi:hypothetical protein
MEHWREDGDEVRHEERREERRTGEGILEGQR